MLFVQQTVCEFTGVKASQAYVHKGVERTLRFNQAQYRHPARPSSTIWRLARYSSRMAAT